MNPARPGAGPAAAGHTVAFDRPATTWPEALPLADGRTAAMCHGGVDRELLQLNADTFWSGHPRATGIPGTRAALEAARAAIADGDPQGAERALLGAQGPWTESYLPLADLAVGTGHDPAAATGYHRVLDLDAALALVRYDLDGATFTRTAFVSAPAGVGVLHLDGPRHDLRLALTSGGPHRVATDDDGRLVLTTKAPARSLPPYVDDPDPVVHDERPGYGMAAAVVVRVLGGHVGTDDDGGPTVRARGPVTVLYATATGFRGADRLPDRPVAECVAEAAAAVDRAAAAGFEALRAEHVAEHRALYRRTGIEVPAAAGAPVTEDPAEPAPALITRGRADAAGATALALRLFRYGRYLLIASSRPGTRAATLQGVWNRLPRPPWSSNYTININTQMNYWPAEPAGLPELHEPLLELVEGLSRTGARAAREDYGLPGWVAHHNTDLWCHATPVGDGHGDAQWANWSLGGAWLVHHVWEHHRYSARRADLDRAWPLLRSAAEFLLGLLVDDGAGGLTTSPSVSPENLYRVSTGGTAAVTTGSTMDLALIAQVLTDTREAAAAVGDTDGVAARVTAALDRLPAPRVLPDGRLAEWGHDAVEHDPGHRHVSHLAGIFPGDVHRGDPRLRAAARASLERRGDASTGWSRAWKANLWARLGDGDRAFSLITGIATQITTEQIREDGGLYANLFSAHPPFQIDGNLGTTAAVCHLLLDGDSTVGTVGTVGTDSPRGETVLLPALPSVWPAGRAYGLRARGGLTVDLEWSGGALAAATVRSGPGGTYRLRSGDHVVTRTLPAGVDVALDGRLAPTGTSGSAPGDRPRSP